MSLLGRVHDRVHTRRVRVLSEHLAALIPRDGSVLDVGAGDGLVAWMVNQRAPRVRVEGIEVALRPHAHIPVRWFDGTTIPYENKSVDVAMFVDVLHHADDPMVLLREGIRVAREALVIKDHARNGFLAGPTLHLMDWVGNARHGVAVRANYWPERCWRRAFEELGLRVESWTGRLGLYPAPASWIFGRSLHFIARLGVP